MPQFKTFKKRKTLRNTLYKIFVLMKAYPFFNGWKAWLGSFSQLKEKTQCKWCNFWGLLTSVENNLILFCKLLFDSYCQLLKSVRMPALYQSCFSCLQIMQAVIAYSLGKKIVYIGKNSWWISNRDYIPVKNFTQA
jgi:hypothetical protein